MTVITMRDKQQFQKEITARYAVYNVVDVTMYPAGISVFVQATPEQYAELKKSANCTDHEESSWDANDNVTEYDVFLFHTFPWATF